MYVHSAAARRRSLCDSWVRLADLDVAAERSRPRSAVRGRHRRQPADARHSTADRRQEKLHQLAAPGAGGRRRSVPGRSAPRLPAGVLCLPRRRLAAAGNRGVGDGVDDANRQRLDRGRHQRRSLHDRVSAGWSSAAHAASSEDDRCLRRYLGGRLLLAVVCTSEKPHRIVCTGQRWSRVSRQSANSPLARSLRRRVLHRHNDDTIRHSAAAEQSNCHPSTAADSQVSRRQVQLLLSTAVEDARPQNQLASKCHADDRRRLRALHRLSISAARPPSQLSAAAAADGTGRPARRPRDAAGEQRRQRAAGRSRFSQLLRLLRRRKQFSTSSAPPGFLRVGGQQGRQFCRKEGSCRSLTISVKSLCDRARPCVNNIGDFPCNVKLLRISLLIYHNWLLEACPLCPWTWGHSRHFLKDELSSCLRRHRPVTDWAIGSSVWSSSSCEQNSLLSSVLATQRRNKRHLKSQFYQFRQNRSAQQTENSRPSGVATTTAQFLYCSGMCIETVALLTKAHKVLRYIVDRHHKDKPFNDIRIASQTYEHKLKFSLLFHLRNSALII